jgi:membrane-associated protein
VDFLNSLADFLLHIDVHLNELIAAYGAWTYAILFAIIFCETGLVVAPFLPGDSLLFAVGALAATGSLDAQWLFVSLSAAAILGNTANYWIGHLSAPAITGGKKIRLLNREYLEKTHRFYEKHGGKTIVIARFMPILRTFAPFVAGIGSMTYGRFMVYNVAAGIAWVGIFVYGGYYFGNIPSVKGNFTAVIAGIVVVSTLPALIELIRHKMKARAKEAG